MARLNKVALITGASGKLGTHVIELLQNLGYYVIVHYNKNHLTLDSIDQFKADFTNHDEAREMMSSIYKKYHNIDIFINMASIFEKDNLENFDPIKLGNNFAIHAISPLNIIHLIDKHNKSECNVINILDDMINHDTKSHLSYTLSKISLLNITNLLSSGYKTDKIRINAVCSKIMHDLYPAEDEIHKLSDDKKESYLNIINKISMLIQNNNANGLTL
jgi:NAD(P)-dependent dehydrogenase (short-subunit alcohol dehydrogenase family)